MNASALAQSAYGLKAPGVRSERETEYQIIARVTGALTRARETGAAVETAKAVYDNTRLWTALIVDLIGDGNRLPDALRAQLISLARFSIVHGARVQEGEATLDALIDVNQSILKGLRGVAVDAA